MSDYSDVTRSLFAVGLRNAHAMEKQALSIMRPQVSRTENTPRLLSASKNTLGKQKASSSASMSCSKV